MIPVIIAGIAGLSTFIGATLLQKKQAGGSPASPASSSDGGGGGNEASDAAAAQAAIDNANALFPALPFAGRPPPITNAQRQAIIAKPPGTLTAADIANLTVDFTPAQTAVIDSLGTPGLVKTSEISAVDQAGAIREGMTAQQFVQSMGGPSDRPRAMVTTNDPSPSGDLNVLDSPSTSGSKIGGAPKGGIVTVMNMDASPDFAEIIWGGGWGFPAVVQYPGVRGFVKKRFLVLQ